MACRRSFLTTAMRPANKFSFPALDPLSDSILLGVSAVKFDAPPGFPRFQTDIKLLHNFFMISRYLEFNCVTFVH